LEGGIAGQNSFNIPTNDYLLVVRGEELSREKLSLGTDLRIESKTVPDDFNNYPNLVGAGPLLLEKGEIVLDPTLEKFSVAFGKQNASRSAIATLNNGKLILLAVHNRPNGKGPNLQELAMILKRLGAVDALNLDGGSSTSLYLGGQLLDRSPVTAARVQNAIGIFVKD
jgi:exopolysaccharide biosynthesis protein